METPQSEDQHLTVTIFVADSFQERGKKKKQKRAMFRKMPAVLDILSKKSRHAEQIQCNERDPSLIKNDMLTSELTIHPPICGKFMAELPLKNILAKGLKDWKQKDRVQSNFEQKHRVQERKGEEQKNVVGKLKDVVIKVYGTRLDIFLAERSLENELANPKHSEEVNKKQKVKLSVRNFFLHGKKINILTPGTSSRQVKLENRENTLEALGNILLPDYINAQTLQFSINFLGHLNIQADIKGAVRVTDSMLFMSTRLYDGSTTQQGVFKPWVSVKCKRKGGKGKKKMIEEKSCFWKLTTGDL